MPLSNYMRAVLFQRPDYIPMIFAVNGSCWHTYPQEALCELIEDHPLLFPGYQRPKLPFAPEWHPICRAGIPYTDDFGCVWETAMDGITGTVTKHPLAGWGSFVDYSFPDPSVCMGIGPTDWAAEETRIKKAQTEGQDTFGGLRHGHTFLQLCDMRGYESLMFDFIDEEPRLEGLIGGVEEFNAYIIRRYADLGVSVMTYAEDLGMQIGPMLSPAHFARYIKPSYQRLMAIAREKGILVHMHSDGDIRTLVDDIIDGGVQVLNLQDLVNGIDWIAAKFREKICIDLDIDRQTITPCGTPAQIDALIRESVEKIGCRAGGLTMIYGLYPGVPLENVKALMDAMERYMGYYA